MDKILSFLETYKGRDRVLRLFCYSTKFIAGSIESPELSSQFDNFSSQLSASRACFRLLDDIPTIASVAPHLILQKDKTFFENAVRIFESIVDIIFGPLDHISWALDHKVIKSESLFWDTASTLFWVISLYISIYKTIKQMAVISKKKIDLEFEPSHKHEIRKLGAQQGHLQLTALKYLCDLLFAVNYLPRGMLWGKLFSKREVGALGTISSLISLYQALIV